jgi:hypothetical protein
LVWFNYRPVDIDAKSSHLAKKAARPAYQYYPLARLPKACGQSVETTPVLADHECSAGCRRTQLSPLPLHNTLLEDEVTKTFSQTWFDSESGMEEVRGAQTMENGQSENK